MIGEREREREREREGDARHFKEIILGNNITVRKSYSSRRKIFLLFTNTAVSIKDRDIAKRIKQIV